MDQIPDISLLLHHSVITFNDSHNRSVENNDISRAVKRLLSSLQSVSKRLKTNTNELILKSKSLLSDDLVKCLSKLETIVLYEDTFAETSVLSSLALALLLNLCLNDTKKAIHLLFKLFDKQIISDISLNDYQIDNQLTDVLDCCIESNDLSKLSLLTSILNCSQFCDHLMDYHTNVFIQLHCHIIKIYNERLVHQFHVFKLIYHWFRVFHTYLRQLAQKESQVFDDKTIINQILDIIDTNWEHPINGVKDSIKLIYNLILEIYTTFKKLMPSNAISILNSYDLIAEEVLKTSRLALTSKAKYRKLSILMPFIGWKAIIESDPQLSTQMLKYISINSLSTAIIELYKAMIISMNDNNNEDLLDNWSHYWLSSISESLKLKNKVIHNNMIAHILPFTIKNIDGSTQLIFESLSDSNIAEVALVRSAIDNNITISFMPSLQWFKRILINNEDIVREEGLSLLLDERFITNRNQVMDLFLLYLSSNLNVDNPSFRQKIVSKIDHFLNKLCISLYDKYCLHGCYDESDLKIVDFLNNFLEIIASNLISGSSYQRRMTCLLLYKDDKVRKLASNMMITFHNNYKELFDYNLNIMADIAINFVNSPRHQETHCGGLIFKYIITCFEEFDVYDKHIASKLDLIEFLLSTAQNQLMSAKIDFFNSSKNSPIHGFLLTLNNCLSFENLKDFINEKRFKDLIETIIKTCFDCIDLMLSQLSKANVQFSPSFQEMCQSLESVIIERIDGLKEQKFDDISASNDFQLLLSMSWLNIKECSFLLQNIIDLLICCPHDIIDEEMIRSIGNKQITILTKCRHKGVIEATCISLTKYTNSLIKMKCQNDMHINTLKLLLNDSLNCISKSAINTNITRKSAGVALIIQAILIGESEAYNSGYKLDKSLYSQTINHLIEIASLSVSTDMDQNSDLPQTYSLHILKSIVNTSSLSRLTIQTVESLLPICIKGFSCQVWQIRNASLQLYGSCCSRMLGQKKTSDVDYFMIDGSTITSNELFSRYPTLFSAFKLQLKQSIEKTENGFLCSELVPIMSLFASFSPIIIGDDYNDKEMLSYFVSLLNSKIWKIRMLTAKTLSRLLPITQLQQLLLQLSSQQNLNYKIISNVKFNKSDDIRLMATKKLNDIVNELNNNKKILDVINSQIILKTCEILFVILEDEDRVVRSEAEIISSKLMFSSKYTLNSQCLSYNTAIDCLFIWLIDNQTVEDQLKVDFLWHRLQSVISLSKLFGFQQQNHILFEKEEKNVFAEPVFQLFKIYESLRRFALVFGNFRN
ncbi:uncharacterized protein LOC128958088 [Oppia nitens]|uniref:uncharacterized protein LOC128958088 n=1 Tax=Oppia nitens TaxID=1686743 RepID=UPI0023DB4797|nr:uncharacterized protein LOC128958088 [Oppia nitens]